jgi:hypothetical protein
MSHDFVFAILSRSHSELPGRSFVRRLNEALNFENREISRLRSE